jgi:hypothetical protein
MTKCNTQSCVELENLILEYLEHNPRSSIREISIALDHDYSSCYKILEGRIGSKSITGLVNSGFVRAIPGIDYRNNRLCYLYELNNS